MYEALCRCIQPGDRPGPIVMKEKILDILVFSAEVVVVHTRLVPARDRFDGECYCSDLIRTMCPEMVFGEPLARGPHRVGLYFLMRTC